MAARLGRLDVDSMLGEMTPEQFDEWMVAEAIGALDEVSWRQSATIAAGVHNELIGVNGFFLKNSDKDPHLPEHYIPGAEAPQVDQDFDALRRKLEGSYGGNNR